MTQSTHDAVLPRGAPLDSLTSLRFVAALAVFGHHFDLFFYPNVPHLSGVAAQAYTVLTFFFLLTGFVLTWVHKESDTARQFYRRRLARIYPNHLVMWLAGLTFAIALGQHTPALGVPLSLIMMQAWALSPAIALAVNPVSWTLSVDLLFYALFPLLIWRVTRMKPARLRAVAVLAVVVSLTTMIVLYVTGGTGGLARSYVLPFFPPLRMAEFFVGIVLALELAAGRLPRVPLRVAVPIAIAAYLWRYLPPVVPFALLIVAVAQSDMAMRPSFLRRRIFVRLGELSFAFYLVHYLVLETSRHVVDHIDLHPESSRPSALMVLIATFGASLACAYLLHRFVEQPGMRRFAGRTTREGLSDARSGSRTA